MADPTMFGVTYEDRDYSTGVARATDADVLIHFKVDAGEQIQYSGLETFGINTSKPFRGKLVAGVLEKRGGGQLQLPANTVELGLDALVYTFTAVNADVDGVPVVINSFAFDARTDDTELNLNEVSPVVGSTEGIAHGPRALSTFFVPVPATDPQTYEQHDVNGEIPGSDPIELDVTLDPAVFPVLYYANLQAAINACSAAGGGVVLLPAGATPIGAKTQMKSRVVVTGPQEEWTVSAYASDPTVYQTAWLQPDTSTTNAVIEFPSDCLAAGLENVLIKGQLTRNGIEFNGDTTRGGNRLRNVYVWRCNKGIIGDQQEVRLEDILVMACASDGVTASGQDWDWTGKGVVGYNGGNGVVLDDTSGPIRLATLDTFFNTGHGLIINGYGHKLSTVQANNNGRNGVLFYTALASTIVDLTAHSNGQDYTGVAPHNLRYSDVLFAHPTGGNAGCAIIGGSIYLPDGSGAPTKHAVESAEATPNFPNLIGINFAGTYSTGDSPFDLVSQLSSFVTMGCNNVPNVMRPQGSVPSMYAPLGTSDLVQFVDDSFTAVSGVRNGGALYTPAVATPASAGAPTLDARTANTWWISLDANVASTTVTNLVEGQQLTIWYGQDGTGGRTYVWPTNCRFAGASETTPPPATTTANRADMVTFISDGTLLREISRSMGAAINAATATKLATARKINGVNFDGSADITVGSVWQPSDQGLISWAFDPVAGYNAQAGPAAGFLYVSAVPVRAAVTITNVVLGVATVGSGLTSGQNFACLYNSAGTLLSSTADQTSAWGSGTGVKTMALSTNGGAQAVTPGIYYVALFVNGTTPPKLWSAIGGAYLGDNIGATTPVRFGYDATNTGLTTAAPATMASPTAHTEAFWAAVS